MTEINRVASCGCSQLKAEASGDPLDVYVCTCLICQKKSGSAFTYAAVFTRDQVVISGAHSQWRNIGESGRWVENHFCPACGISVFFYYQSMPEWAGIPVGCFSDPDFAVPKRAYWATRRHRWLTFPHAVELVDTQPD